MERPGWWGDLAHWYVDHILNLEDGNGSNAGETGDTERSLSAPDGTCGDVHTLLRQRAGVVGDGDQRLVPGER